jgi:hypothetical protein
MRAFSPHRAAALALVAALMLGLAGCETADITDKFTETVQDFNPFGTGKKKLTGDRKPVFPEGVPGVQQGVPPDLLVGAQPIDENPPAAKSSLAEPKPKPAARRRARASAAVQRQARPAERIDADEQPPPARARTTRRPAQASQPDSAWPEPAAPPAPTARPAQAARPGPAPAQSQNAWPTPASETPPTVWPDPPKAGTFTR